MPSFSYDLDDITQTNKDEINHFCSLLRKDSHRHAICKSDPNFAKTIGGSIPMALRLCQSSFKDERWNCTLDGNYKREILRKAYRETAVLHAMQSAALVYKVTKHCSYGLLVNCSCAMRSQDTHAVVKLSPETWQRNGCSDDLAFSTHFLRNFYFGNGKNVDEMGKKREAHLKRNLGKRQQRPLERPRKSSKSNGDGVRDAIDRNNIEVGLQVMQQSLIRKCKCHGTSGSCAMRTCWDQLAPLQDIGNEIRQRYVNAVDISRQGQANTARSPLAGESANRKLLFSASETNAFCKTTTLGPGTTGRLCDLNENCNYLCCGRGHLVTEINLTENCDCRVVWCCDNDCTKPPTCKKPVVTVNCRSCSSVIQVHSCR